MKLTQLLSTCLMVLVAQNGFSQNVGINATGATPNSSAGLDVDFTNKGLLVPRVALTATNVAGPITTPATSLLVYNTATAGAGTTAVSPGYYYWNGTLWVKVSIDGADWRTTGNAGTVASTNFIGTTDAVDFVGRTNNVERFRVSSSGAFNVWAGTNYAVPMNFMPAGSLTIGNTSANFGGGTGWSGSTAAILLEAADNTEIAIHDAGTRLASLAYYDGAVNRITMGRDMGWGAISIISLYGNVGVGVTNPTNKLDIAQTARSGAHGTNLPFYATGNVAAGSAGALGFEFRHDNGTQGIGLGFNTIYATGSNASQDLGFSARGAAGNLIYTTNGTEKMRILPGGNVGIGTTAPSSKLEVVGKIYSIGPNAECSAQDRTSGIQYTLYGTGNVMKLWRGDVGDVVNILNTGFVGIGTAAPVSKLQVHIGNIEISDNFDNMLLSRNTAYGRNFQLIGTAMGWDQTGIYIGGYNQNNLSGAYASATRVYAGGPFGSLPISATAFTVVSSKRYKQNIQPVAYGLDAVLKMRPVQYDYIFEKTHQVHLGLIAEEVNELIPEVVVKQDEKGMETTDVNGKTMGINYTDLTPVLIKAIQEQQAQIEALKQEIEILKNNQK